MDPVGRVPARWRRLVAGSWVAALMAMVAVAVSSRTVGKPPWWLGPSTAPRPVLLPLVPVALVAVALVAVWWSARYAPVVGALCALGLGALAAPDVAASPGVAAVEGAVAAAMLAVSVAHRLAIGTVRRQ